MRAPKKLALAVAVLAGLLVGLANPAAAAGPFPTEVSGGTLSTVLGDFDLTPGSQGIPPCEEKEGTLAYWTGPDAQGPYTWKLTGGFSGQFQLPANSGNWFQADFEILFAEGNYTANPTPPPDYFHDGQVVVEVTISAIGSDPGPYDCSKEDVVCVITGIFTITSGGFVGSWPVPSSGDFAELDADTVTSGIPLATSNCQPPFVAVNGTDASFDDLVLTII